MAKTAWGGHLRGIRRIARPARPVEAPTLTLTLTRWEAKLPNLCRWLDSGGMMRMLRRAGVTERRYPNHNPNPNPNPTRNPNPNPNPLTLTLTLILTRSPSAATS